MHMPKEMDGIVIESVPFSHGIMAHDDVGLDAEIIKGTFNDSFVYASKASLFQETVVVVIASNDVYLAIELLDDVLVSAPVVPMEAEISKMPNLIVGSNDLVPCLYEIRVHLDCRRPRPTTMRDDP